MTRFADGITVLPTVIKPDIRLVEEFIDEDSRTDDDEGTMGIIEEIANNIG